MRQTTVSTPEADGLDGPSSEAVLDSFRSIAARSAETFDVRVEAAVARDFVWHRAALRGTAETRNDGASIRVYVRGYAGFASTRDLTAAGLTAAVAIAVRMAEANARRGGPTFAHLPLPADHLTYRPRLREDPADAPFEAVADLLRRTEAAASAVPGVIPHALFATLRRRVLYADSGGRRTDAVFSLSTLHAYAQARRDGAPVDGNDWHGGELGLEGFSGPAAPEVLGANAARYAVEATRAVAAPPGRHRVLCDNVLSGLLAHESFGHLAEYDVVALGWSRLAGRLDERFASEEVSIVDAPVVDGEGIALPIDDEGVRGRPVRILDRGVLRHWLHARGSAPQAGHEPTGNGRALHAGFPTLVRMRNTYFEPGDMTVEEALEELKDGVYLLGGQGGAPSSGGEFMFTASRGYRVRNGRIEEPLRSTVVAGNIFEFLRGFRGATRERKVTTTNFGGCGKWGQSPLPVGVGGPHVLVESAQVGGVA